MRVLSVTLLLTLFSVARSYESGPIVKRVEQKPISNTSVQFEIEWDIPLFSFASSFEVEVCSPGCYTRSTSSSSRYFSFKAPYYVDCNITVTAIYGWFWEKTRRATVFFRGKTRIGEPSVARMLMSRHRENGLILSWQAPLLKNGPEILYEVLMDSDDHPSLGHRQIRTVTKSLNASLDYFNPPSDFYRVTVTAFVEDENRRELRAPPLIRSFNYLEPDPPTDITVLSRESSYILLQVVPVNPAHTYQYSLVDRNVSDYSPYGNISVESLRAYETVYLEVRTCLSARKDVCGEAFHFETSSNVDRPSPVRSLQGEVTSYFTSKGGLRFSWEPPERLAGPLNGYILTITSPGREEEVERRLPGEATSFLHFPSTKCNEHECEVFNLEISAFNTDLNNGADWRSPSRRKTISIPQASGGWLTPLISVICVVLFLIGGILCRKRMKCQKSSNTSSVSTPPA